MSLVEISKKLARSEVSSVEITRDCLDRIAEKDRAIGAFLRVDHDGALAAAQASDQRKKTGQSLSPLDGIPIALKDMILTQGMITTAGSKILEGFIPPYDATVTKKLKDAGAIILGKLNQDEFAMGSSNETSAYGICHNPVDLTRSPGGSSGGSAAAVAADFCYGTLGTDTGGSIRQPAAFCGVTGIKPTYGRVSRFGIVAFASSLDQVGPFAKDAKSAGMMLQAIAGHDPRDSTSIPKEVPDYLSLISGDVRGLKVGLPKEFFAEGIDSEIRDAVMGAANILRERGAEILDVSLPMTPYAVATYYIIATAEASSNLARYDGVRFGPRLGAEEGLLPMYEKTRGALFGTEVKRRIMLGSYVLSAGYYDAYYLRAQKVRRLFADDFQKAFADVQMILCPTTPTPAFRLGEKIDDPMQMYLNDIYTVSANLAGLPAMSFNGGYSKEGLPLGVQLIGMPFGEASILNAAYAVEQELVK